MSAIVDALLAELDDQALDVLADRLAPRLAARLGETTGRPWLNAEQVSYTSPATGSGSTTLSSSAAPGAP